jgi:hypothetical protein
MLRWATSHRPNHPKRQNQSLTLRCRRTCGWYAPTTKIPTPTLPNSRRNDFIPVSEHEGCRLVGLGGQTSPPHAQPNDVGDDATFWTIGARCRCRGFHSTARENPPQRSLVPPEALRVQAGASQCRSLHACSRRHSGSSTRVSGPRNTVPMTLRWHLRDLKWAAVLRQRR